jgi:phosphoglycolate phosphatase
MADLDYDWWLFDLDGTLVDVDPAYSREVFSEVGDRLGCAFTDREVTVLWHGLHGSRDDTLRRKGLDPTHFWETFHAVEDPAARADATFLYDDAEFVADLDAPVGIVTHCQRYLADPTPVHRAMVDLGVLDGPDRVATDGGVELPGRGVLAGDGPSDVGAAWNAGLDAIHVERHGHDLRERCVRGDLRVASFGDLPL